MFGGTFIAPLPRKIILHLPKYFSSLERAIMTRHIVFLNRKARNVQKNNPLRPDSNPGRWDLDPCPTSELYPTINYNSLYGTYGIYAQLGLKKLTPVLLRLRTARNVVED